MVPKYAPLAANSGATSLGVPDRSTVSSAAAGLCVASLPRFWTWYKQRTTPAGAVSRGEEQNLTRWGQRSRGDEDTNSVSDCD